MQRNLKMTIFKEIAIESKLLNEIQWSWYHSFEKKCDFFRELQSAENPPFRFLGHPVYFQILYYSQSHASHYFSRYFLSLLTRWLDRITIQGAPPKKKKKKKNSPCGQYMWPNLLMPWDRESSRTKMRRKKSRFGWVEFDWQWSVNFATFGPHGLSGFLFDHPVYSISRHRQTGMKMRRSKPRH